MSSLAYPLTTTVVPSSSPILEYSVSSPVTTYPAIATSSTHAHQNYTTIVVPSTPPSSYYLTTTTLGNRTSTRYANSTVPITYTYTSNVVKTNTAGSVYTTPVVATYTTSAAKGTGTPPIIANAAVRHDFSFGALEVFLAALLWLL